MRRSRVASTALWWWTGLALSCSSQPMPPAPLPLPPQSVVRPDVSGPAVCALSAAWFGAAAGVAVHPARGMSRDDVTPFGIDGDGWFHSPDEQQPSPWYVLRMLDDPDLAERILARGTVVEAKSIEADHIIFKARIALHEEDAAALGEDTIRVAIKPAARGIYGTEYRRELAFYKLARYLDAHGVVPIVERDVAWIPLRDAVDAKLEDKQRERLHIKTDDEGQPYIHGTVQLWVEGYMPIIGYKVSSNASLMRLAKNLQHAGEHAVNHDPMWQSISDMFVLDYLVSNSDRSQEAGTVRLRDGGQRLVMLDNGDTLLFPPQDGERELCVERFEAMAMFSPTVVERLDTIDKPTLEALWRDTAGQALIKDAYLGRVLKRMRRVSARVRHFHNSQRSTGSPLFE